jgi:hypothetical protein
VNRCATQNLHRRGCPIIIPQRPDDVFNSILLKEADGGDSGGARFQAGCGILSVTPQSEHGNFPGTLAQSAGRQGPRPSFEGGAKTAKSAV